MHKTNLIHDKITVTHTLNSNTLVYSEIKVHSVRFKMMLCTSMSSEPFRNDILLICSTYCNGINLLSYLASGDVIQLVILIVMDTTISVKNVNSINYFFSLQKVSELAFDV